MLKKFSGPAEECMPQLLPWKNPNIYLLYPCPPSRKSGYREKEFDKLFYQFINLGFKILNFSTVPHTSEQQNGLWVIFVVQAKTPAADQLNMQFPSIKEDQTANVSQGSGPAQDAESVAFLKDLYYE